MLSVMPKQSMNYHPKLMKDKTEEIRATQLIEEVMNHEHKDELINIMYQQLQDESNTRYKSILTS